jgi:hypothetical protein
LRASGGISEEGVHASVVLAQDLMTAFALDESVQELGYGSVLPLGDLNQGLVRAAGHPYRGALLGGHKQHSTVSRQICLQNVAYRGDTRGGATSQQEPPNHMML